MESVKQQEPIVKIHVDGCEVTLLGTAHISRASADKVKELLKTVDFDSVAIELCYSRHRSIIDPDALAKMDLFQVIREGKATMVAASLALGAFQQRMAEKLNIKPGAEMRTAIEVSDRLKMPVLLIDREIGTTLKRVYRRVGFWQRMNLIAGLMASVVSRHEVTEAEIERLKEGDILESTFAQFAEEAKELYTPLVDERDKFMAARIKQEIRKGSHRKMLAVIGAGHLKGIVHYLQNWDESILLDNAQPGGRQFRPAESVAGSNQSKEQKIGGKGPDPVTVINHYNYIPPSSKWPRMIAWAIVAAIFAGFAIGFTRSPDLGWQMVADWVLINGGLAAIGAIIALAHPITIVSAFIAAPITSLNPAIGAGMVTAAIETGIRRPRVEDFSRLRADTTHLKGWWKNSVTRVLLVFLFSTLGSAAGTYVAGYRIFERLAS
ncbi:MAG: TraB/GumN family protein [Gammaproteobacteria bacterium]|nr:TraB/GumN family protein [Gammaproteobacteria bacterium]